LNNAPNRIDFKILIPVISLVVHLKALNNNFKNINTSMLPRNVYLSESEWKKLLNPEAFRILRQSATEPPFTGEYTDHFPQSGFYICAGCKSPLFAASFKFPSHCGWPAFSKPLEGENLKEIEDNSLGMKRVEVRCKACDGHLGHVFDDGPKQLGGLRYCINSGALIFKEDLNSKDPCQNSSPKK
jgi:peptide-methionine (R)-S-oxide reductase